MILTDTGPLVALINRNDPNHSRYRAVAARLSAEPILTTWPCFTEAMYLVHRAGGYPAQEVLWSLRGAGRLALHIAGESEIERIVQLMAQYRDLPMDLADASLIAAAETLGTRRIFTFDSDFAIYRLADNASVDAIG